MTSNRAVGSDSRDKELGGKVMGLREVWQR